MTAGAEGGARRRVGVIGGTFDPIHLGHLTAAEAVREAFDLDQVLFVPCGQPPHKDPAGVTAGRHRYVMALLATLTNPHFEVSRIELDREEPSYTVDTLQALSSTLKGAELFFVIGSDAFAEILTWKEPERLTELASLVRLSRPGLETNPVPSAEALHSFEKQAGARLLPFEAPTLAVSSREIRERVRTGRTIRYLVPDLVEDYVRRQGLYTEDGDS